VTANGGRAEMSSDDAQTGVYAYGALHSLQGRNVESNTRVELGGGAYQYLANGNDEKMTAGVSATLISYANNQNFYTYGHGGYFSPQAYLGLGVPVTWAKRSDRFSFQLKGSVGMQYFRQDGADYFPPMPPCKRPAARPTPSRPRPASATAWKAAANTASRRACSWAARCA
jgi:hypothetical protein